MWHDVRNATLIGAALAAVSALAGIAAAARTPMVPVFIQTLIVKRAPQLAYVPTRIAAPSFKYAGYKASSHGVTETFAQTPKRQIAFTAILYGGNCPDGKQKSFQLSGNKVYWAQLGNTQTAWRCVAGVNGRQVRLAASSTLQPSQLADVGLGTIVASALRVR
jgi:hypothetical protein